METYQTGKIRRFSRQWSWCWYWSLLVWWNIHSFQLPFNSSSENAASYSEIISYQDLMSIPWDSIDVENYERIMKKKWWMKRFRRCIDELLRLPPSTTTWYQRNHFENVYLIQVIHESSDSCSVQQSTRYALAKMPLAYLIAKLCILEPPFGLSGHHHLLLWSWASCFLQGFVNNFGTCLSAEEETSGHGDGQL